MAEEIPVSRVFGARKKPRKRILREEICIDCYVVLYFGFLRQEPLWRVFDNLTAARGFAAGLSRGNAVITRITELTYSD